MKVHFDPYFASEVEMYPNEATPPSVASCGTIVGEEYKASMTWSGVTCKRCLNVKDRLQLSFEQTEEIIIEQMGDAVKFFDWKTSSFQLYQSRKRRSDGERISKTP